MAEMEGTPMKLNKLADHWGRNLTSAEHLENAPAIRVLMRDGKWLVPPEERPKVAPAPKEESRS
jgi:hypothetical protein